VIRRGSAAIVGDRSDGISGHSKNRRNREIVLTVHPGLRREWLEAIIVHEAAHSALPVGEAHGAPWRGAYLRAARELYGIIVPNRGAAWRLDRAVATALAER
jgi:hypothetical protein